MNFKFLKDVLWSINGLVVNVSLISLVVSIYGRPQASVVAIFRQSDGYVLTICSHIFMILELKLE